MTSAPDWVAQAACRGHDPDMWSIGKDDESRQLNAVAKAICATCPVRPQCEQWGRQTRSFGVIMGGRDMHERVRDQPLEDARCLQCDRIFSPRRVDHVYCGNACGDRARRIGRPSPRRVTR